MSSLARIFKPNSPQSTSKISRYIFRLGLFLRISKSKPRIEGPFPYRLGSRDKGFAGRGVFGVCKQFYSDQYDNDQTARSFIEKKINKSNEIGNENPEILAQIAKMNHPNIVQYVQFGKKGSPIIMRNAGQLLDSLHCHEDQFRFYEQLYIYLQILNGTQALHNSGIHHRDLQDRNIAIQKDGTVKIIDLGLSKTSRTFDTNDIITFKGEKYTLRSDMYRLRWMLYTILATYEKIKLSENIKEKEHYKILNNFARSGHFNLSDLILELEKMRDCFPKWGNEQVPVKTSFTDVDALQERFRAKPSSSASLKSSESRHRNLKKARRFFHLGRS